MPFNDQTSLESQDAGTRVTSFFYSNANKAQQHVVTSATATVSQRILTLLLNRFRTGGSEPVQGSCLTPTVRNPLFRRLEFAVESLQQWP